MKLPALLLYFAVCLSALETGCGRGIVPVSAPTISFSANSSSITAGQTSTLSWAVSNATSLQIDNGIGAVQASGSMTVSPTKTTTYTLTASGSGGTSSATAMVSVNAAPPTVTITASAQSVTGGSSVTLTVTATNATQVVVTNNVDSTSNTLPPSGGTLTVTPKATTTYTATATAANAQTVSASTTVNVTQPHDLTQIKHVIFMMQENRSFDSYFGMLNPYRKENGWNIGDDGKEYDIDGIDDKLTKIPNPDDEGATFNLFKTSSSCLDDMTSAWEESFGEVNRYDFSITRSILMNGFVHNAEGYAKFNLSVGAPASEFTDTVGVRAMAYYDQDFLNYYYFMASQFAVSDRWFTPIASKTVPNRIAVMSGGTTQGLVRDPSNDDHFALQNIPTIFQELDQAGVSWKIYYSVTDDSCPAGNDDCTPTPNPFPATTFTYFPYAQNFLYQNSGGGACTGNTTGSKAVGDASNSFCIDVSHIAPLTQYFTDLQNNALPSFAFIEPGYGFNDEHPGSGQSIMIGQQEVSQIVGALISSSSWSNSVFFLSYDEGGGPFDHVPPVPGHTNDYTDASLAITTDISSIAVNPDQYSPCLANGTVHCDLKAGEPGATSTDAAAQQGFAAQLGFRVPNIVISPFTRKHYVSHAPMDQTAIIKFVENRFIGSGAHLTNRDAAQPNLLDFFDFTNSPWLTPPSSIPTPASPGSTCHASSM